MLISKERAKEILSKYNIKEKSGYRTHSDLFNWCEEYKQFINDCVSCCVSYEVDYILKKSYEDNEAPFSYEDLNLFDIDKARETALYEFESNKEEFKSYANDKDTFNRRVKNKSDFEVFLNSLNEEEIKQLFEDLNLNIDEAQGEVYEWWVIQDPLKYRLEYQGEIFLNGACCDFWGRQTTGQSISLDNCCIKAFISILKDRIN